MKSTVKIILGCVALVLGINLLGAPNAKFSWDFQKDLKAVKPPIICGLRSDNALKCQINQAARTLITFFPKSMTLTFRFKQLKKSPNQDITLISYARSSYGRGYFCLQITRNSTLKATFEQDSSSGNKHKFYTLESDKLEIKSNQFYTIHMAATSQGVAKIWLNYQLVASGTNAMSWGDLAGKTPNSYPLLTFGCGVRNAIYDQFFQGLIDDVKLYDQYWEPDKISPLPKDAQLSANEPNLVLDGEITPPFIVPDRETELLGHFVKADDKFLSHAATASLKLTEHDLIVKFSCPIPPKMSIVSGKNIWNSDHIEFFFRPNPGKNLYFQYSIAFDGRFHASKFVTSGSAITDFTSAAQKKVKLEKNSCNLVLSIPRHELGIQAIKPGQYFTGNLIRSGVTSGGATFWKNPGRDFHNLDGFGIFIADCRQNYFNAKLAKLIPGKEINESIKPILKNIQKQINLYGNKPQAWDTLQSNIEILKLSLIRDMMAGEPILIHKAANPWSNQIAPSPSTVAMEKINFRTALNGKVFGSLIFSNLSDRHYLGRIKFFTNAQQQKCFNNSNSHGGTLDKRWSFFTALPIKNTFEQKIFDPLLPLGLNSIFQVAPKTSNLIFFEIDTRGVPAGNYKGTLVIKPSYTKFPTREIKVNLKVENLDLNQVKMDSMTYNYFLSGINSTPNLIKFYEQLNNNIIYIGSAPGGRGMDIYPILKGSGELVKNNFSDLNKLLDAFKKQSGSISQRKLIFFLYAQQGPVLYHSGKPQLKRFSVQWQQALQQWVRDLAKHLLQKYQMPPKNIILYPVDEPSGHYTDAKSSIALAIRIGKLLKQSQAGISLMVNPAANEVNQIKENLPQLAKYYDIFEFYYPHLNKENLKFITQLKKEKWLYDIIAKTTSPLYYRGMGIRNFKLGFSGVAAFWHLDSHAGGDGLNSFDTFGNSTNSADYGAAYIDYDAQQIIPSRRLWAWQLGLDDYRLAQYCRENATTPIYQEKLKTILDQNNDFDILRTKLLNLALELKNKIKNRDL